MPLPTLFSAHVDCVSGLQGLGITRACPACAPQHAPNTPAAWNEEAARRSWLVRRRVESGKRGAAGWNGRLSRGQQSEMNDALALWRRAASAALYLANDSTDDASVVESTSQPPLSPSIVPHPTTTRACLDACVNLAQHLIEGAGCAADEAEALKWLRIAANGGYSRGGGDEVGEKAQKKWANDEPSHPKAQYILAALHFSRRRDNQQQKPSRRWSIALSSRTEEPTKQEEEGKGGLDVEAETKDREAVQWLTLAAAAAGVGQQNTQHAADASFLLGLLTLSGTVVQQHLAVAAATTATTAAVSSTPNNALSEASVTLPTASQHQPVSLIPSRGRSDDDEVSGASPFFLGAAPSEIDRARAAREWLERAAHHGHPEARGALRWLWLELRRQKFWDSLGRGEFSRESSFICQGASSVPGLIAAFAAALVFLLVHVLYM